MRPNPGTPLRPDQVIYPRGVGNGEHRGDSLFLPSGRPARSSLAHTLPAHLREQLPRRLRNIALLYSLAYFLSDLAPDILTGRLSEAFRTPGQWIPGVASMLAGLVVAGLASSPRVSWQGKVDIE
jgi:hypothetical protein